MPRKMKSGSDRKQFKRLATTYDERRLAFRHYLAVNNVADPFPNCDHMFTGHGRQNGKARYICKHCRTMFSEDSGVRGGDRRFMDAAKKRKDKKDARYRELKSIDKLLNGEDGGDMSPEELIQYLQERG